MHRHRPVCTVLGDFMIGNDEISGIFIFESGGILSGVELVGYAGQAATVFPAIDSLRRA
jgi:hypothetical protein